MCSVKFKVCTNCKVEQPLSEFYKNKQCKDGKDTTCKSCFKQRAKEYYKTNKAYVLERISNLWLQQKERVLNEKYNLTLEDYTNMYNKQEGKCAICKSHHELLTDRHSQLKVDHCHATGKVRGLLCNKCNLGLGHFLDNVDSLHSAINYLEKFTNV